MNLSINWRKIRIIMVVFFVSIFSANGIKGQSEPKNMGCLGVLKGGVRIQKAQNLYWENGFAFDYSTPKFADSRIHFGLSYVTSRLGSAIGSNAIKQDNFLVSAGYHFRSQKPFRPIIRLNTGYFYADYENDIFDVLPNSAMLLSLDAGLSYEFKQPITIAVTAGYNINTGNGLQGPGTLYPVYYQMTVFYTIFKK